MRPVVLSEAKLSLLSYRPFVLLHGNAASGTLGRIVGTENTMLQRLHRNNLSLNVPISATETGMPLGRLSDLSLGGFCLVGIGSPPDESIAAVDVCLPWPMRGVSRIRLDVERRWCKRTAGGRWHAGFRITGCPEDELSALGQLSASFSIHSRP